ncbi:hypothetical protein D3C80_1651690 [compost metagenome]
MEQRGAVGLHGFRQGQRRAKAKAGQCAAGKAQGQSRQAAGQVLLQLAGGQQVGEAVPHLQRRDKQVGRE